MIRLVVEAKFVIDCGKLAIFVAENPVSKDCTMAVLSLLSIKPMYIGDVSVLKYLGKVRDASTLIAVELGQMALAPDAQRYVHLNEMFNIAHKILHNAMNLEELMMSKIVSRGYIQ